MFASLPWYDLTEIRTATDSLWCAIADEFQNVGIAAPRRLTRQIAYEQQWVSEEFLFGQSCGYDAHVAFADQLQIVATPCYEVPGCDDSHYRSFVVVREDSPLEQLEDLRGTRCVINTPTSHSGMNILRALVAPLHNEGRFFSEVQTSGSHERSLRMIQLGQVDIAAIDCVTYALLERYRPSELRGSRVLFQTESVPAPPYVTSAATSIDKLQLMRKAIRRALDRPSIADVKDALMLADVAVLEEDAYRRINSLESLAHDHEYQELPGCPRTDEFHVAG